MSYTNKDKVNLIAHLLKQDCSVIKELDEDKLMDYVTCMSSFFITKDPIIAEASIKTMQLIIGKRS
jgi:hypothetical protein